MSTRVVDKKSSPPRQQHTNKGGAPSSKKNKRNSWVADLYQGPLKISLCRSLIQVLTGNFYSFSQHKIANMVGEKDAGKIMRERLSAEFQNLGVMSALFFGILWSQALGFDSIYSIFGAGTDASDTVNSTNPVIHGMNTDGCIYAILTMVSWVCSVLSMTYALFNLVMLNLLMDDEIIDYIRKTGGMVNKPFQFIVLAMACWGGSAVFLYLYIVPFRLAVATLILFAIGGSFTLFSIAFMNQKLYEIGRETLRKNRVAKLCTTHTCLRGVNTLSATRDSSTSEADENS